ncbi:MAG: glycoside hydrolase family 127 protein [Spirochaetales bacterium]|nr:glycoside hydrolase family 127 protein [Spirochaetales bacterium]
MRRKKQSAAVREYPITPVGADCVSLGPGFLRTALDTVRTRTIPFVLERCEAEGRFDNFLIAGRVKPGPVRGLMPFDDSDAYKLIEGASLSLVNTPDPALAETLDRLIETIKIGQEPDGYLTTWFTVDPRHPPAPWAGDSGARWAGEAGSHELYNSGHLFEAAAAHFRATGKRSLLDVALKNADLLVRTFGPGKLAVPPGHQIVEQGLVSLYRITENRAYLDLARFYIDLRGDPDGREPYGEYAQDHLPAARQRTVVGHAVRAVYFYAGLTDVAALAGDRALLRASFRLWRDLAGSKLYLTGGLGARHEREAVGGRFELPNHTAYCETCAAIGSVAWNLRLYRLTGDGRYYDLIEGTLYNCLLAGLGLDGTSFFYVNPLEADGEFAFNHGARERSPWFDCPCCATNLVRFLPSLPGLVYAFEKDRVHVNLFAPGSARLEAAGTPVVVAQETDYPWSGSVRMAINPERPARFTLRLRIPGWTGHDFLPGGLYKYADEAMRPPLLTLNGNELRCPVIRGYAEIKREWQPGDAVEIDLALAPRRVVADPRVAADRGLAALTCGPLVYCVEGIDNNGSFDGLSLPAGVELERERRVDALGGAWAIAAGVPDGNGGKRSLLAVPYYAWANRGSGPMKVWLPRR